MLEDKVTGYYLSNNNKNQIAYYIHKPCDKPIGILQLSHGMCEYFKRYNNFIKFMNENGILVCGNDHLGHGNSVFSKEDLGYFGDKDSWCDLPEDLYKLTKIIKEKYPHTPYFLLGHSMGSFIERLYISKYGNELDGAIIVGTGGKNSLVKVGIAFSKIIEKFKGERFRSNLIDKLVFGKYNNRFKKRTKFDWLTRDENVVDNYIKDDYCNFLFTVNGFETLFYLNHYANNKNWGKTVPKSLPIFIISGKEDPVGDYGKGVQSVYNLLKDEKINDLSIKLYENSRHEIINEINYIDVYNDVLNWVKDRL